jgi:hypothetical protein
MTEHPIAGTWGVTGSTDPRFEKGVQLEFFETPGGLVIAARGGPSVTVAWSAAEFDGGPDSQGAIFTGTGTIWVKALEGAYTADLAQAVEGRRAQALPQGGPSIDFREFAAGEGQLMVLYEPFDSGEEIDAGALLAAIAADAARRLATGWRMVSMVGLPLRHAGVKLFGVEGSGYTTKAALGVLYATGPADAWPAGIEPPAS